MEEEDKPPAEEGEVGGRAGSALPNGRVEIAEDAEREVGDRRQAKHFL